MSTATICRACGAGHLVFEDDGDFVVGSCDCGHREAVHRTRVDPEFRRERRRIQAGFPARFLANPFIPDEHNREAVAAVTRWLDAYKAWRTERAENPNHPDAPPLAPAIHGRPGRGKTLLLVRLGLKLIDADATVLFRPIRQLLRELSDFEGDAREAWDRALRPDVLLLDDIGAERDTEWRKEQLADLIDERYQRQLPVALTSNFPPGAWTQVVADERTASRLREITFPVELDAGPDRRRIAQPQQGPSR